MAIYINTLIGGNITIGSSGGGSTGHADTIFTFTGNRIVSKNISGELGNLWKYDKNNGDDIFDYEGSDELFKYHLASVDIGNTVSSIGDSVFQNCTRLTSVTIPNSVTSIGDYTFENCRSLTSVTIDKSKSQIESMGYQDWGLGIGYNYELNT